MTEIQFKRISDQDISECENALTMARVACARLKRKVSHVSSLYDALDRAIKACDEAEKEVYNAP